ATLPPIVPAKAQPTVPTAPAAVAAATPAVVTEPAPPPAIATPTVTVLASVDSNKPVVAPVPMPASMRPKPQLAQPLPGVAQRSPSIEPFPTAVPGDSPVVVLDPVPQQDSPNAPIVTERDLAGWKSGTLADYLASKGLLSNSKPRPRAPVNYDQNGFFLSDGPNADRYYRDDTYVN
ncbi:MAG: hypothetical protein JWN11_2442, partial [Hyphomicrobiales bacterium]|nr:hypothetical protein [Hyphomicrobiales bacterium]